MFNADEHFVTLFPPQIRLRHDVKIYIHVHPCTDVTTATLLPNTQDQISWTTGFGSC